MANIGQQRPGWPAALPSTPLELAISLVSITQGSHTAGGVADHLGHLPPCFDFRLPAIELPFLLPMPMVLLSVHLIVASCEARPPTYPMLVDLQERRFLARHFLCLAH